MYTRSPETCPLILRNRACYPFAQAPLRIFNVSFQGLDVKFEKKS